MRSKAIHVVISVALVLFKRLRFAAILASELGRM
jgi:hypothetical protein